MNVNIDTKMVTLLGMPLAQSFSPRMQNAAYEAAGLNMIYYLTETDGEHLEEIVTGLRYQNIAGFAVTKPNKIKVLQYLDELDPLCEKMGASNTVVKTADGKLVGYNTDGVGFYQSLVEDGGVEAKGHVFYFIGAGGAGRAMASVLAYNGAEKIYISDYFAPCADSLVEDINNNIAPVAVAVPYGDFSHVGEADCVLNASGIGMGAHIGETPMPPEYIVPGKLYYDACYNPDKTQFLLNAEAAGCRVLNGLGMCLYQGAAQIELWSGQKAPVEAMRQELLDIVAGK